MKTTLFIPLFLIATLALADSSLASDKPPVRVAVIGGMTSTGMWTELAERFTADTGWPTELVATGPKVSLTEPFQRGEVDLLTMHGSIEATDLVANGYGRNLQPWARNEHTIVGPPSDPAGIRGMKDGAEALKKIAAAHAPFVDFYGPGSRELAHRLWKRAGLKPEGDWVIKDESVTPQLILSFAEQRHAYVVVGRIAVNQGKMPLGNMEILVSGDPEMRRPYVLVEADPRKFPQTNAAGADALAAWLTGDKGQEFIREYGQRSAIPLYFPIASANPAAAKTP